MVGIILSAGTGSRLYPATKVINKNVLSLYDKPVIYYSISIMMMLEIYEIVIVCNKHEKELYFNLLGSGENLGLNIKYVYQEQPNGIVDAVLKCKIYAEGKDVLLLLGDNFFYGQAFIDSIMNAIKSNIGATMFCTLRDYDHVITTVEFDKNDKPVVLERLKAPKRHNISPGIFVYDKSLYKFLAAFDAKNEWVDINKKYLSEHMLNVIKLKRGMFWFDVGMPGSRLEAETLISLVQNKEGNYIGCIEEIAYQKKLIDRQELKKIIDEMKECEYKRYLQQILLVSN